MSHLTPPRLQLPTPDPELTPREIIVWATDRIADHHRLLDRGLKIDASAMAKASRKYPRAGHIVEVTIVAIGNIAAAALRGASADEGTQIPAGGDRTEDAGP